MIFDDNSKDNFCLIFIKTYVVGADCSLELPQGGNSNEHPQHRFL